MWRASGGGDGWDCLTEMGGKARFRERFGESIFEELKKGEYQADRYNVSKLIEILVVRELALAMDASGKPKVILNTLTPGFCHSELMRVGLFRASFFQFWMSHN
jgi:hypothetical protein